jgi:hypothetical protein
MAYGLSFSEAFFVGEGDIYEIEPSDRPTNVFQAIISLPRSERVEIAREVLGSAYPERVCDSEYFAFDVLEKIRENNTCDDLSSPVTVYIDRGGWYSVTVYDDGQDDD